MTLSRFLRDYLYIPLGGNRHGPARRYLNLMITMLLGGLWHGILELHRVGRLLHGVVSIDTQNGRSHLEGRGGTSSARLARMEHLQPEGRRDLHLVSLA
jgi:D-alanyl-lipoteichoic acid acyltransferase DltB (MBOAT superfamily)